DQPGGMQRQAERRADRTDKRLSVIDVGGDQPAGQGEEEGQASRNSVLIRRDTGSRGDCSHHRLHKGNNHSLISRKNQVSVFIAISTSVAASSFRPVLPTTRRPCVKQTSSPAVPSGSTRMGIEPSRRPCRIKSARNASFFLSESETRAATTGSSVASSTAQPTTRHPRRP